MSRQSNGILLLLSLMEAGDNVVKTSGTCGMCEKYKSLLVHDKRETNCFPTCIECLKEAVGELRSD